jgi:hypothetical protein
MLGTSLESSGGFSDVSDCEEIDFVSDNEI